MKASRLFQLVRFVLAPAALLLLGSCIYEAPLTEKPARKINERLLGDWIENSDSQEGARVRKPDSLRIRKLNDWEYVVEYHGFFRAFHSTIQGRDFVTLQTIDPVKDADQKYAIVTYKLTDHGYALVVRAVNQQVIPASLKTTAALALAVAANLDNPDLMGDPAGFARVETKEPR